MSATRTVGIVGATGAVGVEIVRVLEEREFPMDTLRLLASPRSAGREISFRGIPHRVEALGEKALDGLDLCLFAAGSDLAREWVPRARQRGAVVVDNSSAFRSDPEVPLVVPEINGAALAGHRGLIANPNCSTILLVMVLCPLDRAASLRRVAVATYQAASGAGRRAMAELDAGSRALLAGEPFAAQELPHTLAFNLLPQIDQFSADGYTREEDKMLFETRRILGLPQLQLEATCVRVPVRRCHSEVVTVELERELAPEQARAVLAAFPGVSVDDDPARGRYPMPAPLAGTDEVVVGRVRRSRLFGNGLSLWLVGDQLRKGAALNAVQIAEALVAGGGEQVQGRT